jgi:hypothetical protein
MLLGRQAGINPESFSLASHMLRPYRKCAICRTFVLRDHLNLSQVQKWSFASEKTLDFELDLIHEYIRQWGMASL